MLLELLTLLAFYTAILFVASPFGAGAALAVGAAWRGHPAVRVVLFGYGGLGLAVWSLLLMWSVR